MAAEKAETGPLWWAGVATLGLVFLAYGYGILPIARERLVTVELEAPLSIRQVLIELSGRNPDSYYTQYVDASLPDRGKVVIRPVAKILIPEIETLKRGQVRFLVDPSSLRIYEAAIDGRIVQSYVSSAGRQRSHAFIALGAGVFCVGVGVLGLAPLLRARDKKQARPNE
ncbi:hypothetical protein ACQKLX_26735 [Bosea sp. NPDC003192]|uniref:hypothetical protein n=1 Tax=Bosea sp. NPDC003192 TaxID=3390551 RepID=UPI003D01C21D